MNNERMQLTYLDVFNNLNAKNIYVSGVNANSGLFNSLDLNNIDTLNLSGVDISITSGNVSLTNRPTVNGTGVVLSGELNPIIINTGSLLNNKINSLSGYVNSQDIIFSGQISNTGSRLDNKINSLSGYVNSLSTSGQIFNTGSLLDNKINSLSGYVNSQDIVFSGQTFNTGSRLDNKINSLSGYINSQDIIFSGQVASTGSILDTKINSLSGLFVIYTGSLDATFASDAQLFATGSTLDNKINSLSGYVNYQDNIFSGQTFNTGSRLDNKINSLSGYVDSKSITLPTTIVYTTGDQIISGNKTFINNIAVSGTGDFNSVKVSNIDKLFLSGIDIVVTGNSSINIYNPIYISGNPVLTGVDLSSYATNANLINTGSILDNKINSLSGWSASATNLANTGSILDNKINSLSGAFTTYTGSLDANFATDAQLFATGSVLDNKVNSLSGYINSQDIIFSGQIFNTGSKLDNKINSLSGYIDTKDIIFSGQIASTGSNLNTKINNLSGYINSSSSNIVFTIGPEQKIFGTKVFDGDVYATGLLNRIGRSQYLYTDLDFIFIKNYDGSNILSAEEYILFDAGGTQSIPWASRILTDSLGQYSLDWDNRNLINKNGSPVLYWTGNNIGIGTNNPTEKLEVDGNIKASGASFNYRPTVNGTGVLLSGEAAALPNTLVYTTGNQTISGVKSFTQGISVTGGSINLIGEHSIGATAIGKSITLEGGSGIGDSTIFSQPIGGNITLIGGSAIGGGIPGNSPGNITLIGASGDTTSFSANGSNGNGRINIYAAQKNNDPQGGEIVLKGNTYINPDFTRSREFIIYKSGDAGLNTATPNLTVSQNSINVNNTLTISGNYDIYSQIENSKKLAIAYAIAL